MALLLTEPFTGADGTLVENLTGWDEHASFGSGSFIVTANRARATTTASAPACCYNTATPTSADYYVEAVLRCISVVTTRHGIAGRINTAADTMYYIHWNTTGDIWELRKRVAGTDTQLDTFAQTIVAGTDYAVRLEMIGDQIKGYVNGVERLQATDSAITAAGKAGIIGIDTTASGAGVHVDSLTVGAIPNPFPTIASTGYSEELANVTSNDVILPPGFRAGDRLVLFLVASQSGTISGMPAGWTRRHTISRTGATTLIFEIWEKFADGSETNFAWTGPSNKSLSYCLRITDSHASQALEVTAVDLGVGNANPPSETASWGAENNLWIAGVVASSSSGGLVTGYPTNYGSNQFTDNSGPSSDAASIGIATRELNAATEDPGAFTEPSSNPTAFTIVVRPGTPPDTTPPTVTVLSGPTLAKISSVSGKDSTDITWESNENFTEYKIKVVPATNSIHSAGTQLEANQTPASGGTAGTDYTATITDDEMIAATAAEGSNLVKVFTRDAAGNWST